MRGSASLLYRYPGHSPPPKRIQNASFGRGAAEGPRHAHDVEEGWRAVPLLISVAKVLCSLELKGVDHEIDMQLLCEAGAQSLENCHGWSRMQRITGVFIFRNERLEAGMKLL